jgi:hypothetical protein
MVGSSVKMEIANESKNDNPIAKFSEFKSAIHWYVSSFGLFSYYI